MGLHPCGRPSQARIEQPHKWVRRSADGRHRYPAGRVQRGFRNGMGAMLRIRERAWCPLCIEPQPPYPQTWTDSPVPARSGKALTSASKGGK